MIIEDARRRSGLTQDQLADRAGTSRPTLSAYENGRKSPRLDTLVRIVGEAGFHLELSPHAEYREFRVGRGRSAFVPRHLTRLPIDRALATVELPLHIDWSSPSRTVNLSDRPSRLRAYEALLREGTPTDLERFIDGVLLIDAWDDLVVPQEIRSAWAPLIQRALGLELDN